GLSLGMRLLLYMISGLRIGSMDVTLPNGSTRRLEGTEPGPHGVWHIKSNKVINHLLASGEVGIGDAYLEDLWESPDLTRLLHVMHLN
ncbi:hypothetical protein ABTA37_19980, partial [Acinetobacter baumannii]